MLVFIEQCSLETFLYLLTAFCFPTLNIIISAQTDAVSKGIKSCISKFKLLWCLRRVLGTWHDFTYYVKLLFSFCHAGVSVSLLWSRCFYRLNYIGICCTWWRLQQRASIIQDGLRRWRLLMLFRDSWRYGYLSIKLTCAWLLSATCCRVHCRLGWFYHES